MMNVFTEVMGLVAAIGAALVFFPQVLKVVKTKHTKDLSRAMWIAFAVNNITWILYGILSRNYAILLTQVFIFPMGLTILWYKVKYK